jgi:hypothetical protein
MLAPTEKSGYICHGVPPSPPQPQPQMMARGRRLTAQLLLCSVAGAGAGGVRRRSGCVSGTASTPQLVARHAPTPVRGAAPTQQPLRRASSARPKPVPGRVHCALPLPVHGPSLPGSHGMTTATGGPTTGARAGGGRRRQPGARGCSWQRRGQSMGRGRAGWAVHGACMHTTAPRPPRCLPACAHPLVTLPSNTSHHLRCSVPACTYLIPPTPPRLARSCGGRHPWRLRAKKLSSCWPRSVGARLMDGTGRCTTTQPPLIVTDQAQGKARKSARPPPSADGHGSARACLET